MKRPIGVILTCVVLGFLALIQLALAVLGVFGALITGGNLNQGPTANNPFIGLTILLAALALWMVLTLVGLFRLRVLARYSILFMAGCIFALNVFLIGRTLSRSPALSAAANPHAYTMHNILLFEALACIIPDAIAGWWLVYFNLLTTKTYFLPGYQPHFPPGPTA